MPTCHKSMMVPTSLNVGMSNPSGSQKPRHFLREAKTAEKTASKLMNFAKEFGRHSQNKKVSFISTFDSFFIVFIFWCWIRSGLSYLDAGSVAFGWTQINFCGVWTTLNKLVTFRSPSFVEFFFVLACISSTLLCSRVSSKPVKSRIQTTRLIWNKATFAGNRSGALRPFSSSHHLTLMTSLAFKSAFSLSLLGASVTHGTNLNCDKSRGHLALKVSRPVLLSFGMSPRLTHQLLMSVGLKSGLLSWTDNPRGDPAEADKFKSSVSPVVQTASGCCPPSA